MSNIETIENDIETAIKDLLAKNGVEWSKIATEESSKKQPFRAGGLGPGQRLSSLSLREVTLYRLRIDVRFALFEKRP